MTEETWASYDKGVSIVNTKERVPFPVSRTKACGYLYLGTSPQMRCGLKATVDIIQPESRAKGVPFPRLSGADIGRTDLGTSP
jgi:hypothetical protein